MKNSQKNSRNKLVLLTACAGLLSLTAAGCNTDSGARDTQVAPGNAQQNKEMTLNMVRYEHPAQVVKQDSPVLKEIYKKTGVKLQVEGVPQSNYTDKKKILVATNNIPDVILVESGDIQQFAKTGIFLNISDYLEHAPNFKKAIEANPEIKKLMVDGKLYGFPITSQYPFTAAKAPIIRTDILKKLNLPIPQSYDELYTVLKKLKEAYPDSYPFTSRGTGFLEAIAFGMGSGNGIYYDPDVNGGSYVYANNKPAFKQVLAYISKMYSEKLIDPDFAVNTLQKWTEKMSTGKSFFYIDNNTFAVNFNQALNKETPEAKLDLIPFMKHGQGKARGFVYAKGWILENYAISSKVKDPVAVVKFYDWLYSPEGTEVTNFGVLGETYEKVDGKPKMLQSVIDKYKNGADPSRLMQSELGLGYLAVSPNVNESPVLEVSDPALARWAKQLEEDPGFYRVPALPPPFTAEENEKIKQITSKLSPINGDVLKFMMGARPLGEFDRYAEELTKNGVPELEKIYNDALARVGR
jgi:putative aldouronate transport system substrate-binding protein